MNLLKRRIKQPAGLVLNWDLLPGSDAVNPLSHRIHVQVVRTHLKHIAVRIKNFRSGWRGRLGRTAASTILEPYIWTDGYRSSFRAPRPRGTS